MKKLKFAVFSALALGLTLTSCGDDDSNSTNTDGSIVGTWTYNREATVVDGEAQWDAWPHTEGCDKDYIVFSATTAKDVMYFEECEEEIEEAPYVKNGNNIAIQFEGGTIEGEIIELTSSIMKIKSTYTYEDVEYTDIVEYKK